VLEFAWHGGKSVGESCFLYSATGVAATVEDIDGNNFLWVVTIFLETGYDCWYDL